MFLIRSGEPAKTVFFAEDPRDEGYCGEVEEGVIVENPDEDLTIWPDGADAPMPSIGLSPTNPKQYRFFKWPKQRQSSGYLRVRGTAAVSLSFEEYRRFWPSVPIMQPLRSSLDIDKGVFLIRDATDKAGTYKYTGQAASNVLHVIHDGRTCVLRTPLLEADEFPKEVFIKHRSPGLQPQAPIPGAAVWNGFFRYSLQAPVV